MGRIGERPARAKLWLWIILALALFLSAPTVNAAITVDGDSADWDGINPDVVDNIGDSRCNGFSDIKYIYTIMDDTYVYVMVETADKPIDPNAVIEINFDYKPGSHFRPEWDADLHTNISGAGFSAWTDVNFDDDRESYPITGYQLAWGQVMEIRIPLAQIENPTYFRATDYVNIWDYDFSEQRCDQSWFDSGIEASVKHVHEPDDSFATYMEVVIGNGFGGIMPAGIDSITVVGPSGLLPIGKNDFVYEPQWRDFFVKLPGPPEEGTYTFRVTSGVETEFFTDTQGPVHIMPNPDETSFSVQRNEIVTSKTPIFSCSPIEYEHGPVFYRLEIYDENLEYRIWASSRVFGVTQFAVPAVLEPGRTYHYRFRASDSSDWIAVDNRSNSDWIPFQTADVLTHPSVPAIDLDGWGVVTWTTEYGTGLDVSIKVIDHDGIAFGGSSHSVEVTVPGSGESYPLYWQYNESTTAAFFSRWIDLDGNPPTSGDYVFTVTDPDGNEGTYTDTVAASPLLPPDQDSFELDDQNNMSEQATVYFDNITVNGVLYEDFNSYSTINDLDPAKWIPVDDSEVEYAIESQKLRVQLVPDVGHVEEYLGFVNPMSIESVGAEILVDPATTGNGEGRIQGVFFNNGSGDVLAELIVTETQARYQVLEIHYENGLLSLKPLAAGTLASVSSGVFIPVSISWNFSQIEFSAAGGTAQYTPDLPVNPPQIAPGVDFLQLNLGASINLIANDTTPTFEWDPVSVAGDPSTVANRYRVRIYDTDGNNVWRGDSNRQPFMGNSPSYTVPPGVLKPYSVYKFRIEARDAHGFLDIDNASEAPPSNDMNFTFLTGPDDPAPFIELSNNGVRTFSDELRDTYTSFWIFVYDAKGIPENIASVKVKFPGIDGIEVPLYYNASHNMNLFNRGVYINNAFSALSPQSGTYTFTVVNRDDPSRTFTVQKHLEVDELAPLDTSTFLPAPNTLLEGTGVEISWAAVPGTVIYMLEVYDVDFNLLFEFFTTGNSYTIPPGLLKTESLYRYRVFAWDNFLEESPDNISMSPWSIGNAPTFLTTKRNGSSLPVVDLENKGARVLYWRQPEYDTIRHLLEFSINVTDADGVPANIKSVRVTYPDGTTSRELRLNDRKSSTEATYYYVEDVVSLSDIDGTYVFEVTDFENNTVTREDELVVQPIGPVQNWSPAADAVVSGTTPTIAWSAVTGASRYQVRVYNGWSKTLFWSDYLTDTHYIVPAGKLDPDRTYSYKIYAYREQAPEDDFDNYSIPVLYSAENIHFTTTGDLTPDSDNDGLSDDLEAILGTDPYDADSDEDGILDGDEDVNRNGVVDFGETDPRLVDSDGDGLQDGTERGYTDSDVGAFTDLAIFVADADNSTTSDPLRPDMDDDGLLDGTEDANRNGAVDSGETDPFDFDSDDDGFSDGAEDAAGTDPLDADDYPFKREWDNLGLYGGRIEDIAVHPSAPSRMFAASYAGDGLFYTSSGGSVWEPALTGAEDTDLEGTATFRNTVVRAVQFAPSAPDTVWAVHGLSAEKSTDGGVTWTYISNERMQEDCSGCLPNDAMRYCRAVAIDPGDDQVVYVGTGGAYGTATGGAVYKTSDGGVSWAKLYEFDYAVIDLAIDPTDRSNIWALTALDGGSGPSYGSLYISSNGGSNWSQVFTDSTRVYDLVLWPGDPGPGPPAAMVGTACGIYSNLSGSWEFIYPAAGGSCTVDDTVQALAFDSLDGNIFYAATKGGDMLRGAIDPGATPSVTFETSAIAGLELITLEAHPTADGRLYGGDARQGVFRIEYLVDSGEYDLTALNQGINSAVVYDIDSKKDAGSEAVYLIAATDAGPARKAAGGSWASIEGPLPTAPNAAAYAVAFDPTAAQDSAFWAGGAGYLAKTVDGGASWSIVNTADFGADERVTDIEVAADGITLVATTRVPGGSGRVLRSGNGGATLTSITPSGAAFDFNAAAIDPTDPDRLFAGGGNFFEADAPGKLYESRNGGSSWSELLSGQVYNAILIDPDVPSTVYVGCGNFQGAAVPLYRSTDSGVTWQPAYDGAPGRPRRPAVWGSGPSDVYFLGHSGSRMKGGYDDRWILHYNGVQWAEQDGTVFEPLRGIWGSGPADVFAVGASGAITHFDGSRWSAMEPADSRTTLRDLNAVWGRSATDVYAVGDLGVILHYDGSTWSRMRTPTVHRLYGVWGTADGARMYAVGAAGCILEYDGTNWSKMPSPTKAQLTGIWGAADGSTVYAVGSLSADGAGGVRHTILRCSGGIWTAMETPDPQPGENRLYGIWGTAADNVVAVGARGAVLHYNGSLWQRLNAGVDEDLLAVWGAAASDVYVAGERGVVLYYHGGSWTRKDLDAGDSPIERLPAANAVTDIKFKADPSGKRNIYMSTDRQGIYFSPNRGDDWINLLSPPYSVFALETGSVYVASYGVYTFKGTGYICGEVKDEFTGVGIDQARVSTDTGFRADSNDRGVYVLPLEAGVYNLSGNATGYKPESVSGVPSMQDGNVVSFFLQDPEVHIMIDGTEVAARNQIFEGAHGDVRPAAGEYRFTDIDGGYLQVPYPNGWVELRFDAHEGYCVDAVTAGGKSFGSVAKHLLKELEDPVTVQVVFGRCCWGDFDRDGDVDGSDLAVFARDFGRTDCLQGESLCEGDFDGDGDVDGSDLADFARNFGRTDCK